MNQICFIEKKEEQEEQKKRKIKLLGQKINVATMKIEILQNYKKNNRYYKKYRNRKRKK